MHGACAAYECGRALYRRRDVAAPTEFVPGPANIQVPQVHLHLVEKRGKPIFFLQIWTNFLQQIFYKFRQFTPSLSPFPISIDNFPLGKFECIPGRKTEKCQPWFVHLISTIERRIIGFSEARLCVKLDAATTTRRDAWPPHIFITLRYT